MWAVGPEGSGGDDLALQVRERGLQPGATRPGNVLRR